MLHKEIIESLCKHFGKVPEDIAKKKHGQAPMYTYGDILSRILVGGGTNTSEVFPEMSPPTISTVLHRCFPGKVEGKVHWYHYLLSILELKRCTGCTGIMGVSNFYSDSSSSSGLKTICKSCNKERGLQYRIDNKEEIQRYRQQYRIDNKESIQEYQQQYRIDNKESILEYQIDNKESKRKYDQQYRIDNKEAKQQYQIDNKEAYATNSAKYRASKMQALPAWANLEEVALIYLHRPEGFYVDHLIPLQGELVCGLHCEHNLQYLLCRENLSKGNKFSIEDYTHSIEYVAPYL